MGGGGVYSHAIASIDEGRYSAGQAVCVVSRGEGGWELV